ncbi:cytochrome b5-like heme/steroid binding domain-containing protein, partial [Obelidium mucronatum]
MEQVLHNLVSNPINWVLGVIVLYLAFAASSTEKNAAASVPAAKHPEIIELKNFTPKELSEFDGRKSKRIYLCVKGRVYDVTSGASFYGPEGMYGNFAGRDASRGLAKDSFDEEMVQGLDLPIDELTDLSESEVDTLNNWASFFHNKYTHVGYLVNA